MEYKNFNKVTTCFGLFFSSYCFAVTEINVTPSDLADGQLPSGYDVVNFSSYNGNYTKEIFMPIDAFQDMVVNISSTADYSFTLNDERLDVLDGMMVKKNESFSYEFDNGSWEFIPNELQSPTTVGDTVDTSSGASVIHYRMWDGVFKKTIFLPDENNNTQFIIISSEATYDATIDNANLVAKKSTLLEKGDEYIFEWDEAYSKWLLVDSPEDSLLNSSVISTPKKPTTKISINQSYNGNNIYLPSIANEGDQIVISSSLNNRVYISNDNINESGILPLNINDKYEFTYNKILEEWFVTDRPTEYLNAKDIPNGELILTHSKTEIRFADANYVNTLHLPNDTQPGYRVIIDTDALYSFDVIAEGMETQTIHKGELVSFIALENGQWKRETITVDLLLLYSDKNINKLGAESAAKARLIEGFDLTNDALENSGANYRFRMVALEVIDSPDEWEALGDALSGLRDNEYAQGLRNQYNADGIYYEGTESGCGLAYVRASAYNMVATGSLNCGTTVMRHELGHNMSLNHGISEPDESTSYAVGYSTEKTVMGGNQQGFFATPYRISPRTQLPLGFIDKIDAVRAMDEFSHTVAAYR